MSFSEGIGLRERKRAVTRDAITTVARSLTARQGVRGFTIEEVCTEVEISRRTFFNYFPTKEDAILGRSDEFISADLADAFIAGGSAGNESFSATMVEDFVTLADSAVQRMAVDRAEILELREAVLAEPQLLDRFIAGSKNRRAALIQLLAARESVSADDPRLPMVVDVLHLIARRAASEFFMDGTATSFREALEKAVDTLQSITRSLL